MPDIVHEVDTLAKFIEECGRIGRGPRFDPRAEGSDPRRHGLDLRGRLRQRVFCPDDQRAARRRRVHEVFAKQESEVTQGRCPGQAGAQAEESLAVVQQVDRQQVDVRLVVDREVEPLDIREVCPAVGREQFPDASAGGHEGGSGRASHGDRPVGQCGYAVVVPGDEIRQGLDPGLLDDGHVNLAVPWLGAPAHGDEEHRTRHLLDQQQSARGLPGHPLDQNRDLAVDSRPLAALRQPGLADETRKLPLLLLQCKDQEKEEVHLVRVVCVELVDLQAKQ